MYGSGVATKGLFFAAQDDHHRHYHHHTAKFYDGFPTEEIVDRIGLIREQYFSLSLLDYNTKVGLALRTA